MADLGAVPAYQIEVLPVCLQTAGIEAVSVHRILLGFYEGAVDGITDPVVDHSVGPLVRESQVPLAAELQQGRTFHVGAEAHVVFKEDAFVLPLVEIRGGISDDHAVVVLTGHHQHPVAIFLGYIKYVGITEIIGGIILVRKGILFDLGKVQKVGPFRMHNGFCRCIVIVMTGKECMVAAFLILHHAACAQGVVLFRRGIAVGKDDARILISTVILCLQQSPGMIAGLAVSLVQQIIDVHGTVLKIRHGITDKTVLRHRKQRKSLFPGLVRRCFRIR